MNHETPSRISDTFILELDGEHSDSITPLSPVRRARLEKIRAMYVKAGIIPDVPPPPATDKQSPTDSSPEAA